MEYVKSLSELSKTNAPIAGGKGASLGEMTRAGLPVPPGFVVLASAFDAFIQNAHLEQEITQVLEQLSASDTVAIEQASKHIQGLILEAVVPSDVKTDIMTQYEVLHSPLVAVRSSATAEDSATSAWAGQLESYLNTDASSLLDCVQNCWASLFSPRAISYRIEKGMLRERVSVAVVVQAMIQSEVSGIAFSVHPVTQNINELIIEAGFGLGEAVVSGAVTPDSYVVDKILLGLKSVAYAPQQRQLVFNGSENTWQTVPEALIHMQKLDTAHILELSKLIIAIEKHYGFPCDVEWAFVDNAFFITQSRPITTLA